VQHGGTHLACAEELAGELVVGRHDERPFAPPPPRRSSICVPVVNRDALTVLAGSDSPR
jgi:hypothetical protein